MDAVLYVHMEARWVRIAKGERSIGQPPFHGGCSMGTACPHPFPMDLWQRGFGSILFGTRETICAIWNACTSTRPNMAMCRWSRTGPIRHFIDGWRQMPIGCMLPSANRTIIW